MPPPTSPRKIHTNSQAPMPASLIIPPMTAPPSQHDHVFSCQARAQAAARRGALGPRTSMTKRQHARRCRSAASSSLSLLQPFHRTANRPVKATLIMLGFRAHGEHHHGVCYPPVQHPLRRAACARSQLPDPEPTALDLTGTAPAELTIERLQLCDRIHHRTALRDRPARRLGRRNAARQQIYPMGYSGLTCWQRSWPEPCEVAMCRPARCRDCGGASYSGCGRHVDAVLANVPPAERCACRPAAERHGQQPGGAGRRRAWPWARSAERS